MKNTGYTFELLAKDYFEKKLQGQFGYPIVVHHRKKYHSNDANYEIDLSFEFSQADLHFLVLIECKNWSLPVDRDQIMTLTSKVKELNAHKGIVISSAGFQEGAIQYAIQKGIGLIKLSSSENAEVISHFIGQSIDEIRITLETPAVIVDEINSGEGMIVPKEDILNHIAVKYGPDVSSFILRCLEKMNSDNIEPTELLRDIGTMDQTLRRKFSDIPPDWFSEYNMRETCGLDMLLTNEFQSRQINSIIATVQMFDGNDIA